MSTGSGRKRVEERRRKKEKKHSCNTSLEITNYLEDLAMLLVQLTLVAAELARQVKKEGGITMVCICIRGIGVLVI
jgi:hypothetical protein